jgi:hypothetical protein
MNPDTTHQIKRSHPVLFDDNGRAILPSKDEIKAMAESIRATLEAMASIPDDPPGSDLEFMKAIDAERPERPLFSEYY